LLHLNDSAKFLETLILFGFVRFLGKTHNGLCGFEPRHSRHFPFRDLPLRQPLWCRGQGEFQKETDRLSYLQTIQFVDEITVGVPVGPEGAG
jgi:hypothetical protein